MTELGLRERKKQRTRQLITETALALFAERGFDNVAVAEIARAAEVSEATVFNYFRTKEALVFNGMEDFGADLLEAISARPQGVSVLAAFAEFVVQPTGSLTDDDPEAIERLAAAARMTAGSAALQARERELLDEYTTKLAELLTEETGAGGGDITPWVVANALMGVQRGLKEYLHREVLAGRRGQPLIQDMVTQGRRALELLERGLTSYPEQGTAPPADRHDRKKRATD
ncbi:AcrR family transcriptional regulator [Nocardia sp. GAS34]|uniref:TetR/AcrR family transcriptional regulator n=1 Tax=unclassified Nocardia TaxID=2637762 RepID=UPI003D1E59FA